MSFPRYLYIADGADLLLYPIQDSMVFDKFLARYDPIGWNRHDVVVRHLAGEKVPSGRNVNFGGEHWTSGLVVTNREFALLC